MKVLLTTVLLAWLLPAWVGAASVLAEQPVTLTDRMHHLRHGSDREWDDFPAEAEGDSLEFKFSSQNAGRVATLELRQQDVKQTWQITLNDKRLARLVRDENDMVVFFDVPSGAIQDSGNRLRIHAPGGGRSAADDIRVGQIRLHAKPRDELLSAANVSVKVTDAQSGNSLPARITVLNVDGALQTVGANSGDVESGGALAVRPGTVYTSTGDARFGLPPGAYRIFAGRGFEYSLDSTTVTLAAGDSADCKLSIRREVPTPGYVACDTHIHTLTHSGHGDATVQERMITLAAECIELAIATDHNVHIDHDAFARKVGVRQYFTPVIGNEVTTPTGHFNIFPVRRGAAIPDYKTKDWGEVLDRIYRTPDVKVAILNHARDTHGGVRPFGPQRFNDVVGENLDGWAMRFNAMEVLNSSAAQTDVFRLFHDWMALLNRGRSVTPVGSSDSHDVARHFVGQGRTYIRCQDTDPGSIDVDSAVANFLQGRVNVSYGLLTELTVENKYRSGELAQVPSDTIRVSARVLGPHWTKATNLTLYANGQPIREVTIPPDATGDSTGAKRPVGVKWEQTWSLPRPAHDIYLVALASGPGIDLPYWKTAKPYQPDSAAWKARVIGCSGAVRIDCDQDGRFRSAYDYALRLIDVGPDEPAELFKRLAGYDQAVAAQAAHLYQQRSGKLLADKTERALKQAPPHVRAGFRAYTDAWRTNQLARGQR